MTALYRPPVAALWWTRRRSYLRYMARELTCLAVAWFAVLLLLLAKAVGEGEAAYTAFLAWAARPWVLAVNLVALALLVLHSVTWFGLAPKAIAPRVNGRPVPARAVVAAHYALWAAVSLLLAWAVLR